MTEQNNNNKFRLNAQQVTAIATALLAAFTLLMVFFTYQLAKSTNETTIKIAEMTERISDTSTEAAEITKSVENIARSTAAVARSTDSVARATAEMARALQQKVNPAITISLIVKSEFHCDIDGGISFKPGQYLWKNKNAEFYIAVKNEWSGNIDGTLRGLGLKISLLNTDNDLILSRTYYEKITHQQLGPSETSKLFRAANFEQHLANDFNWSQYKDDKIIRIEIDKSKLQIPGFSFPGVKSMYFRWETFQAFVKTKNKTN